MLYTIKFTFKRGIVSCMKNVEGFLLNTDLFIETGQDYWSLFSANENELFLPLTRNDLMHKYLSRTHAMDFRAVILHNGMGSFSKFAKFSEKLTFPTPDTHT